MISPFFKAWLFFGWLNNVCHDDSKDIMIYSPSQKTNKTYSPRTLFSGSLIFSGEKCLYHSHYYTINVKYSFFYFTFLRKFVFSFFKVSSWYLIGNYITSSRNAWAVKSCIMLLPLGRLIVCIKGIYSTNSDFSPEIRIFTVIEQTEGLHVNVNKKVSFLIVKFHDQSCSYSHRLTVTWVHRIQEYNAPNIYTFLQILYLLLERLEIVIIE